MNRLSREWRAQIVTLLDEGKSIREIAGAVGCHRDTVLSLSRSAYKRKLAKQARLVLDELDEKFGIDPADVLSFMTLYGWLCCECPVHPDAYWPEQIDDDGNCDLCKADAQARWHERRAEQGLPKILPPWRKPK